ncbi:hypothetical protein MKQ68_11985 [Chitinophaga horti]|uniref:histidine kinase n=1 Tax=Chitinophaga horti TaxID=2920382 RepID=A0ABY6J802_9BACT|nr:histidine kinase dimerization/phosphoacceptor domain -containing protein [Chitinophaga horti]UYQ95820.1 hypothetical protein MKQ68_11985 [Chitinophaga horti]
MKRIIVSIVVILACLCRTTAQEQPLRELPGSKHLPDKAAALIKLAEEYRKKPGELDSDLSKAADYARQALHLAEQTDDETTKAQAHSSLILTLGEHKRFNEAYRLLPYLDKHPRIQAEATCVLGWNMAYLENERTGELDTARLLAQQTLALAFKLKDDHYEDEAQRLIARNLLKRKDLVGAKAHVKNLLPSKQGAFFIDIAECYVPELTKGNNLDSALANLERAVYLSAASDSYRDELRAMIRITDISYFYPNDARFDNVLAKMENVYKRKKYPHLHYVYSRLRQLHSVRGNKNMQLYYAEEAVKSALKSNETYLTGQLFIDLGTAYRGIGEHEKSLEAHQKALQYFPATEVTYQYIVYEGWIFALRKLKRYQEALDIIQQVERKSPPAKQLDKIIRDRVYLNVYRDMGEYAKAEPYGKRLPTHYTTDSQEHLVATTNLAQLYVEWGQYAKAKPLLDHVYSFPLPPAVDVRGHFHYLMFKTDSALGHYASAIQHLVMNKEVDDSVLTASKMRQVQEYKVKYETEKKDHELLMQQQDILELRQLALLHQKNLDSINLCLLIEESAQKQTQAQASEAAANLRLAQQSVDLLKKDTELKQARLNQANILTNATISAIVLLLLILALIINSYFSKQRKNREISQKNEKLEHLVKEKEWLLQEVHHRVKNNLQTVVSLLESQSGYLSNEALRAITESRNRVYAMSLIHQKLYRATHVSSINMASYLPELIEHLRSSFTSNHIQFDVQVSPVEVDVSQAIPLGLILNETITNSLKYAFPNRRSNNQIKVWLQHLSSGDVELLIADNGVGMPSGGGNKGLGLKLITGLSGEIDGTLTISGNNGMCVQLRFKPTLALQLQQRSAMAEHVL